MKLRVEEKIWLVRASSNWQEGINVISQVRCDPKGKLNGHEDNQGADGPEVPVGDAEGRGQSWVLAEWSSVFQHTHQ